MKRKISGRLILTVAGIFILSGIGMAAEFSADLIQSRGKTHNTGKLYMKGGKARQEINGPVRQIVIQRPDKKLVWSIDPIAKTYMTVSPNIIRGLDDPEARLRIKHIGVAKPVTHETVNGYVCERRQWVTKGSPPTTLTEWYSKQLGLVVRVEIREPWASTMIEYKNIKVGGVADSLFEIPKGYKLLGAPARPKLVPRVPPKH